MGNVVVLAVRRRDESCLPVLLRDGPCDSYMVYITGQLFARPTISIGSDQLMRLHTKQLDFIQNNLNNETVAVLSNDIWENCQKTLIKRNNSPVDPSSDDPY